MYPSLQTWNNAKGKNIVPGLPGQVPDFEDLECSLQLVEVDGKYQVVPV